MTIGFALVILIAAIVGECLLAPGQRFEMQRRAAERRVRGL